MNPTTPAPELLKTVELVERIRETFNVSIDSRTVNAWVTRPIDALPTAFQARRGQSHQFAWDTARPWLERELTRPLGEQLDALSLHEAKTVSARIRARVDAIELAALENRFAEVSAMEQAAEDTARLAVNRLMAIPARLAPRLARISDEVEIDRLLDQEIRAVCAEIEAAAAAPLGQPELPADAV